MSAMFCGTGIRIETFYLGSTIALYPCTYTVHVNDVPKGNLWVPGSIRFLDFGGLRGVNFVPFLLRADEERVDVVFEQKLVPVTAVTIFYLVGAL